MQAAPLVADLLAACPQLTALVTSRTLLRVRGARQLALSPLALPDAGDHLDVAELVRCDVVRLFVERARALTPDLSLTPEAVRAIAAICRRGDGRPLAIELAAARVRLLPLLALLARLERADHGAPGNWRAGRSRPPDNIRSAKQTLRATIAWSYVDQLDAHRSVPCHGPFRVRLTTPHRF